MDLLSEIKARRARLGLSVAQNPVVSAEVAAQIIEARKPKAKAKPPVVDGRKPKVGVVLSEDVPPALQGAVAKAQERIAGCYASRETRMEILTVLEEYDTNWLELLGPSRRAKLANCRREVYRILHKRGWSYNKIGDFMNRDHTSVMHGVRNDRKIQDEVA